jgi:hypothetical protein
MKKNMGMIDKIVRVIVAITFTVLYFMGILDGTLGIILIVLSVVFLLTSMIGFCPLYTIFGMNTCKVNK